MENAFNQIKESIERSANSIDLQKCFRMITSFRRDWKYNLEGSDLEDRLLEIILNQQEIICQ